MSEPDEHYIAIDPLLLKAIRETAWLRQLDRHVLPTVRLLLEVAAIDPTSGNIVIRVRFLRELAGDDDPA